jgi:hypothetical protein
MGYKNIMDENFLFVLKTNGIKLSEDEEYVIA